MKRDRVEETRVERSELASLSDVRIGLALFMAAQIFQKPFFTEMKMKDLITRGFLGFKLWFLVLIGFGSGLLNPGHTMYPSCDWVRIGN